MTFHRVLSLAPHAAIAWFLIVSLQVVLGAEFRSGERPVIKTDEVIDDDLYIFGDEVTIDGEVKGDVVAFGRYIKVNGSVEGDLIAAGQAVVIGGQIGDDVRMAGQVLKIDSNASIADDLIAAGFSLEIGEASTVGGDIVYAGYQAQLAGDVGGYVNGAMANCEIIGNISGDVNLNVNGDEAGGQAYTAGGPPPVSFPSVPPGLTIRSTARLDGELKYTSPKEANTEEGAVIAGEVTHERPELEPQTPPTLAEKAMKAFGKFGTLLIVGLGVVLVAPGWTRRLSDNIQTRPLASLGLGAAGMIGFVVLLFVILLAMIILAIAAGVVKLTGLVPVAIVLGLSGGVMLTAGFWFFTTYLAAVVVSFFVGSWLLCFVNPALSENRFLSLLVGLVLLGVISYVPFLGSIVGWVVVLLGLGALVGWLIWQKQPEPAPAG